MRVSWKSAAILLLLNFSLVFYGHGMQTSVTSLPYTQRKSLSSPLNGNWHLTGVNSHLIVERQLPFLSFAIEADGSKIYGQGNILIGCENSWRIRGGGTVTITGEIAPDGTFEADDYKTTSDYQFSIHGTVPQSGDTSWHGTYTLKNLFTTEPNCIFHESGAFTATKYPPFTGTYTGTLNYSSSGTSLAVTLQITQAEPGDYSQLGFAIPLGAQITVFGSACFTRGTVTSLVGGSLIEGDKFFSPFSMDDGALFHLSGERFLGGSSESTIDVSLGVNGGQCDGETWSGTLTR